MDVFDQVFAWVSDNAGNGASNAGQLADWAIKAGLSLAEFQQIMQGVANRANVSPLIVADTQAYLQTAQSVYAAQRTSPIVPLLIVGAVLYFATRD